MRAYELRRNGDPVRLARQPMDVLLAAAGPPSRTRHARADRATSVGPRRPHRCGRRHPHGDFQESDRCWATRVRLRGSWIPCREGGIASSHRCRRWTVPRRQVKPRSRGTRPLASPARHHNLPAELTSFVGRRRSSPSCPGSSRRLACSASLVPVASERRGWRAVLPATCAMASATACGSSISASLSLPELVPQTIATALGFREGRQQSARDVLIDTPTATASCSSSSTRANTWWRRAPRSCRCC